MALVGFGAIAERTHLPGLARAGCQVVAVAEICGQRRAAARRCLPDAAIFADLGALLAACRPDFLDICSPPAHHREALLQAAAAGLHVLCEKPLLLTSAAASAAAAAAQEAGTVIGCVHNWCHAPIVARLRGWVLAGRVGDVRGLEMVTLRTQPAQPALGANWRCDPEQAGGGILFDHGWHGLSVLRQLCAAPVVAVQARLQRDAPGAAEHAASVELGCAGGISMRFSASWRADRRHGRIAVLGSEAAAVARDDVLQLLRGGRVVAEERFVDSLANGGYPPAWTAAVVHELLEEIAQACRRGAMLRQAREVLSLLEAAYAAAGEAAGPLLAGRRPARADAHPGTDTDTDAPAGRRCLGEIPAH